MRSWMPPACLLLVATSCGGPSLTPCSSSCPSVGGDYGVVHSAIIGTGSGSCGAYDPGYTLRFVQQTGSGTVELQPTVDAASTLLGHLLVPDASGDVIAVMESHLGGTGSNLDFHADFLQSGIVQGDITTTGLTTDCSTTFSFTAQK